MQAVNLLSQPGPRESQIAFQAEHELAAWASRIGAGLFGERRTGQLLESNRPVGDAWGGEGVVIDLRSGLRR